MVWNDPFATVPAGPTKAPGSRMTQALGLLGSSLGHPGSFAIGFRKVSKSNAKKLRVKGPIKVPHEGIQLKIPEFRLPFSDGTVFVDCKGLVPILNGSGQGV